MKVGARHNGGCARSELKSTTISSTASFNLYFLEYSAMFFTKCETRKCWCDSSLLRVVMTMLRYGPGLRKPMVFRLRLQKGHVRVTHLLCSAYTVFHLELFGSSRNRLGCMLQRTHCKWELNASLSRSGDAEDQGISCKGSAASPGCS